jgi:hypothetical protein
MLGLNLAGYYCYGLTGLGISFLLSYFLYAVQVYLVSKRLFQFKIDSKLVKMFFINMGLTVVCLFFALLMVNLFTMYLLGSLLIVISVFYNLNKLDKLMGLKEALIRRKNSFLLVYFLTI